MESVTLDDLVSQQIKDVIFLKEHGLKEELKPFIFPYLISKNESFNVGETHFPDIPIVNLNDFQMTYILNLNIRFNAITTWDFLTVYKMKQLGLEKEEAVRAAFYNLKKMKIIFSERQAAGITYYKLQFDNNFVNPSFCNSMLLLEDIWKKISIRLNLKEYYIFPLYQDCIFISEKMEFSKKDFTVRDFKEILKVKENYYTVPFTDRILFYIDKQESLITL